MLLLSLRVERKWTEGTPSIICKAVLRPGLRGDAEASKKASANPSFDVQQSCGFPFGLLLSHSSYSPEFALFFLDSQKPAPTPDPRSQPGTKKAGAFWEVCLFFGRGDGSGREVETCWASFCATSQVPGEGFE